VRIDVTVMRTPKYNAVEVEERQSSATGQSVTAAGMAAAECLNRSGTRSAKVG
jgi:hypothetical protein